MQQFLAEFIGHFHPVVVHLPIGFILLAAVLYVLSLRRKYDSIKPAVEISLLLGMLSAVVASITGYLLSTIDDYDQVMVTRHQWFGIVTAIVSGATYYAYKRNIIYARWLIGVLVILITVTGHLGGSLTHGEDYLTQAFENYSESTEMNMKPIADVQEASVYQDVIRPILSAKCYGCHSKRKQKGGLRLDEIELIMKGGKDGVVIEAGDAQQSELVHRVFLPREHEDHMPPKEKSQPTENQIHLLSWWIANGAPADKKVRELEQPEDVKKMLFALQSGVEEKKSVAAVPTEPVNPAQESRVSALRKRGVSVIPVSQGNNYISVNYINADTTADSLFVLLLPIKKQVIWLKVDDHPITDADLKVMGQLNSLTKLQLSNTTISDEGLAPLKELKNLEYLNLAGTNISANGILQLKDLQGLRSLYLFKCNIMDSEYELLSKAFPLTTIDRGGYHVPTLDGDTTVVTVAKKKD